MLIESMHKWTHGRPCFTRLNRIDSRRVALPPGVCLDSWKGKMTSRQPVENKGSKRQNNYPLESGQTISAMFVRILDHRRNVSALCFSLPH